jgi:hypothetical protein
VADKADRFASRIHVALALTDISRMPRPWEKKQFDWVTTDFVYVRWLGGRKGMER